MAVVGPNADELGIRMAERHGLAATSMDQLMKGRKGRRTDAVKAKAASNWLADENGAAGEVGWQLTNALPGFPETHFAFSSVRFQALDQF